jgi:RiboL-PSP-HEPN
MFGTLKAEITSRILRTEEFFGAIHGQPGSPMTEPILGSMTARGLIFVDLYGTYEYTVKTAVDAALTELKKRSTPFNRIRVGLLGVVLNAECSSAADSGRETMWHKRIELFQRALSTDLFDCDPPFPNDGSHFREKQLETIWKLFGIVEPIVPNMRLLGRIGELVDNRNDIAHGNRTAAGVGCRYSAADIRNIISAIQAICLHVAVTFETHCAIEANLCR